jgi:hypothetical protein
VILAASARNDILKALGIAEEVNEHCPAIVTTSTSSNHTMTTSSGTVGTSTAMSYNSISTDMNTHLSSPPLAYTTQYRTLSVDSVPPSSSYAAPSDVNATLYYNSATNINIWLLYYFIGGAIAAIPLYF